MTTAPAVGAGLEIAPAGPTDETFLSELFVLARPQLQLIPLEGEAYVALVDMQRRAQRASFDAGWPGHVVNVVRREGARVAMTDVARDGAGVHLLDIAVHPAVRSQGIASALVRQLLADHAHVSLTVAADNPALALYRRLGFAETSRDPVYVAMRASARSAT